MLADARPSALLALVPLPIVLADARPSALPALAPLPIVLADARPSALLALAPSPSVLADAPRLHQHPKPSPLNPHPSLQSGRGQAQAALQGVGADRAGPRQRKGAMKHTKPIVTSSAYLEI